MPLVSVVTTFHNAELTIQDAINSLLCQSYSNFEHILVNDGSDDDSVNKVRKIKDERIVLVEPGRVGRAKALNVGLERAKGNYVAILDADDIALPERLLQQKIMLDADTNLSLVCSNAELIDEQGVKSGETSFPIAHQELIDSLMSLNPFPHSSVMYRRKFALNAGGYNLRCEKSIDYNFYLDLLLAGGQFSGFERPLIRLRSYPASWGKNDNHGLQIRYGIMGLINYFQVLQGKQGIMRVSGSDWPDVKKIYDIWFEQRDYQGRMDAKKTFVLARHALKQGRLIKLITSISATLRKDPLFWLYRGCGFQYPVDIDSFLSYLNKKLPEFD